MNSTVIECRWNQVKLQRNHRAPPARADKSAILTDFFLFIGGNPRAKNTTLCSRHLAHFLQRRVVELKTVLPAEELRNDDHIIVAHRPHALGC